MKKVKVKTDVLIILAIGIMSLMTYWWTINLPIIGDGLMHLNDTTDLSSIANIIKVFYTFEGVGKPENSATLGFHRPVFNEIIVTVTKSITNLDVGKIRIISVCAFSLMIICSYMLGKELFDGKIKAIILAILMNFSIIFYSGVYEYGLSFSIWLTLFVIAAFYFTVKYVKYDKKIDLIFSFMFTALAMYTKESAMCLGIALSWYVFVNEISKKRKLTVKVWLYGGVQFVILAIYLYTRYLKLGNVFTAVAVDSGEITVIESIKKIFGYYFLSYNVPNEVIPAYMCMRLTGIMQYVGAILFTFSLYILVEGIDTMRINKQCRYDIIAYIGMYIFLLVPVFKVNRNAPYYGDICVVSIFAIILTVIQIKNKKNCIIYVLLLLQFIILGISNMFVSTREGGHYLSIQSNEAKVLRNQLWEIGKEIDKDEVILTTNWAKNSNSMFVYHHNGYGSFYKYNIDSSKSVKLVNDININNDALFIDYFKNLSTNKAEVFLYPQKDTKIAKVIYGSDNKNVEVGFSYNGNYYYSNIDVEAKKQWSNDNCIYCIIPQECNLDIVGSDCSLSYLRSGE